MIKNESPPKCGWDTCTYPANVHTVTKINIVILDVKLWQILIPCICLPSYYIR